MIATDENALICDLAETYHIFNYRELPVKLLATLSVGLRKDSRIMMKLSGQTLKLDEMLWALMLDDLNFLVWAKTKDGQKNRKKPKSIFKMLNSAPKPKAKEIKGFDTVQDFMKARQRILERSKNGWYC